MMREIEGYKEENEQPLYIVDYKDKYGNIKYPYDSSENYEAGMTYNHVADQNLERIVEIDLNWYKLDISKDIVEIDNINIFADKKTGNVNHTYILCTIIKLLCMGKRVIYRPKDMDGYNESYNQLSLEKNVPNNNNEFIFVPKLDSKKSTNFIFKPGIHTNQVIILKPSTVLIRFLLMFLTLDDVSGYLSAGSYQFVSRVRIEYLILTADKSGENRERVKEFAKYKGGKKTRKSKRKRKTRKHNNKKKNKKHKKTRRK